MLWKVGEVLAAECKFVLSKAVSLPGGDGDGWRTTNPKRCWSSEMQQEIGKAVDGEKCEVLEGTEENEMSENKSLVIELDLVFTTS